MSADLSELTEKDWYSEVSSKKQKIGEQTQEIDVSKISAFTINAQSIAVFLRLSIDGKTRTILEVFQNGTLGSKEDYQLELMPGFPYKINVRYQGLNKTYDVKNSVNNNSIRHYDRQFNARLTFYLPVWKD